MVDEEAGFLCLAVSSLEPDLAINELSQDYRLIQSEGLQRHEGPQFIPTWFDPHGARPLFADQDQSGERMRQCMHPLYEEPTKNMEAHAMKFFDYDHDMAHDVAITTLMDVCSQHAREPVLHLASFYTTSVKRRMRRVKGRLGRGRQIARESAYTQRCWKTPFDGFTSEHFVLMEEAIQNLDPQYRNVVRRYKEGGSFAEIAEDLGITRRQAYDRFDYAKSKLRQYVERRPCSPQGWAPY